MTRPRLYLTPGEPAGIGPDITVMMAQEAWPVEIVVIADPELLQERAAQLGLPLSFTDSFRIHPVRLATPAKAGQLNPSNAKYVLQTLQTAVDLCRSSDPLTVIPAKAGTHFEHKLGLEMDPGLRRDDPTRHLRLNDSCAIVTGPVNKEVLNTAGIPFTGHTEFFAQAFGVPQTVMLFVVDELKVALVTTHLPLANVPAAITPERLETILRILHQGLQQHFHLEKPRLLVCGLNPHAGEGGYLGREEIEVISPTLDKLREQGYLIHGPLAADTAFTPHFLQQGDAVLAMYHDQALPLVKYLGFGNAVNVTLGLPFVRTSVDHGTAIDVAGSGRADAGSMRAAMQLAIKMIGLRQPSSIASLK